MAAPSWRTTPKPQGWGAIRQRILKRDNHACQMPTPLGVCGAWANEVDHITPASLGGSDEPANLRSLCGPHHKVKSSREGGQASAAKRIPRNRPAEQHPGLR
ncbi:HNH endonuclease [Nonomuraea sp. NPDC049269]|uniref:HNH endonuclease n=1 Tax=Nonomuraea sp. NPDC049269 TaxID=3364349 RepID=UPI00371ECC13